MKKDKHIFAHPVKVQMRREIDKRETNRGSTTDGGLSQSMLRLDSELSDEHAEIRSSLVAELSDLYRQYFV
eukprot:scaffold10478_cov38-Cyclotella_meneghiniana.AAC.3